MNEMLVSFFSSGIWGVIKAVLLLLLAFITAAVVKSLVVKLFTKTKLNTLLKQTGAGKRKPYHFRHGQQDRHLYGRHLHGIQ